MTIVSNKKETVTYLNISIVLENSEDIKDFRRIIDAAIDSILRKEGV